MKTFLLSVSAAALVAIGAMAFNASPARAQEYAWCAVTSLSGGSPYCGYSTYDQCMASILGGGGYCQQNPRASAPAAGARRGAR